LVSAPFDVLLGKAALSAPVVVAAAVDLLSFLSPCVLPLAFSGAAITQPVCQ